MENIIKKIILVLPNALWSGLREFNIHPYSLCLLGSVLKDKYDVRILDANSDNLTVDQTVEEIIRYSPEIVGVSCMSIEYAQSAHKLLESVKSNNPEVTTILGGVYPTVLPEFAIKDFNIDFLVLSEGEYRLPQLLNSIEKGLNIGDIDGIAFRKDDKTVINKPSKFIQELDLLPLPDYGLVNYHDYIYRNNKYSLYNNPRYLPYAVTISSRGCPFDCVYCSSKTIQGRKCRMRSYSNVLEEIDWLVAEYGIKELIFLDDNLLLNRKRVKEILNGLIDRNYDLHWKATNVPIFALDEEILTLMKKSGCYQITLPVESGCQSTLDNIIRKPLKLSKAHEVIKISKSMDFEIACLFVIGLPGETWDQILDTINFADTIDVDWVAFSIATPLPKTDLYKIAKENGYLDPDFNFSDFKYFGFGHGAITTKEFTPIELQMVRAFNWDRINFKTIEKQEKIAMMNSITMEELNKWRISTRRNIGVNVTFSNEKK